MPVTDVNRERSMRIASNTMPVNDMGDVKFPPVIPKEVETNIRTMPVTPAE